jgi:hypothetical protein
MTPAALVAKFDANVVDTSDKFATGVVDTGGKFDAGVIEKEDDSRKSLKQNIS